MQGGDNPTPLQEVLLEPEVEQPTASLPCHLLLAGLTWASANTGCEALDCVGGQS